MRKKVISTFTVRVLSTLFSMAAGILIARILGPTGRGEFFLAITIIGMVQQFGALGLHSSNVYQVAANRDLFPGLAANSLLISLLIGVASVPVLLILLPRYFPNIDLVMAGMIALAIAPSIFYLLMSNLLLGVDRVKEFNLFELLSRLLPLVFIGAIVFISELNAYLAVLSSVLAVLLSAMLMAYYALPRQIPRIDVTLLKVGINYGLRAYVAAILVFMLSRAGGVLLGLQNEVAEVGHLSIALQLADFMTMLPATVGLILFPRLVGETEGRGRLTIKAAKIVGGMMMVACIVAGLLADPLIPLVFGKDFTGSVKVFQYMLPGIFALSLITVVSQYLAAHGIPWALIVSWVIGLILMVSISWLYIPKYGASAVAIAMSVSYCAVCILLVSISIRKKYLPTGQT